MTTFTTEITSDTLSSDKPIHHRLLQAYYLAKSRIKGDLLEIGCGEGRGIEVLLEQVNNYTALDKNIEILEKLKIKYPKIQFVYGHVPPLSMFEDNSFDAVVAFQVIEHIKNDYLFVKEIHRVLKPNGVAILTTPNNKMTLSRNPWHIREYVEDTLEQLLTKHFSKIKLYGIDGKQNVLDYHEKNRKSVQKIMRFDIFNLQYRLPSCLLQKPYEILNRLNRNSLKNKNHHLVNNISKEDYFLAPLSATSLDFFAFVTK